MTTRDVPPAFPDPYRQPTLSVGVAGAYLGLGRAQAYAAASRGEIPTMRVGRRILVPTAMLARRLGLFRDAPDDSRLVGLASGEVAK